MSGKTIMPGLINAHGHLNVDSELKTPVRDQLVQQLRIYADYGVTTVVSLGSTQADELDGVKLRDEQESGRSIAPGCIRAAINAVGKTPEEARKSVDRHADLKVDIIKFHINGNPNDMTPDVYGALIDEAHKRGLRAAVHIFYLKDAHGRAGAGRRHHRAQRARPGRRRSGSIAAIKTRNVGYIPTLTRDLSRVRVRDDAGVLQRSVLPRGTSTLYRRKWTQLSDPALQEKTRNDKEAQTIKVALAAGEPQPEDRCPMPACTIAMGTDSGREPRAVAGLLRARRARDNGQGRHDADAGARGRDRRRRAAMKLDGSARFSRGNGPICWC